MWFLFGQYSIIPKKKIGHNQKRTTLEPLASSRPGLGLRPPSAPPFSSPAPGSYSLGYSASRPHTSASACAHMKFSVPCGCMYHIYIHTNAYI